jgi:protein-tyrosine phosphatase
MKTVLFLSTGNYYRGRFAEILFNSIAARDDLPWKAESRGLGVEWADHIGPIAQHAVLALESVDIEIDAKPRPPLQATKSDLEKADLIVGLKESEHRPMLEAQFPGWAERAEYWQIDGLDCGESEIVLPELEREVQALVLRLKAPKEQG